MSDNKLKVMHLIWSMKAGGAQQVVLNYLRDFNNDEDIDMRLYVYCACTGSKYDMEIITNNYPVVYLNNPKSRINIPIIRWPFNRMVEMKTWEEAIKGFNPDIVHVHISGLLSVTLKPIVKCDIPVRFNMLHSNPYRYKGRDLLYIKQALRKEKFIPLCVTNEQANMAKEYYGIADYELVRNGIDIEILKKQKLEKKEARAILKLPKEAYIVIGVGRLNRIKNFELLIKAFKIIANGNDKALLLFAGDGEERQNLQKLSNELDISDRVIFLGNRNDMPVIYSASDVLGMTSISEAAPLTLIEAQALGLKCVISNGVPKENIVSNSVEQINDSADEHEWARALTDVKYRNECYGNISEYDVHQISNHLKQIYLKYWKEYKDGQR